MQTNITNASLSPGTLVGRYEIREILGVGGFGITYKAWDTKLNRLVAMKEYLPAETAVRVQGSSQINAYESRGDEYQYGLERFLDEAKTLAKFHHPNIIGVLDHLELNNTAYLIMTYEQGQTLSQQLKQYGGKLPELELKAIVKAMLTGLQHIHEHDYYHRDIKPGNIYLRKQGEPVLIDFGAARQAIGARSRSLTNIVSAGYAPSEQYGSNQSKQGAWSDLYAVGATMYRSISGQEPTDAPTRQNALFEQDPDPLIPAAKIGHGRYTEELLQLIDWMLSPAIKNRPQNVAQVMAKLESNLDDTPQNLEFDVTKKTEEARSTVETVIVKEQGYQSPEKPDEQPESNRYQPDKPAEKKQSKPKLGLIITGISVFSLAAVGISQKDTIQQFISEQQTPDTPIPEQTKVQTQKPKIDDIEAQVQNRVKQELAKQEQHRQRLEKEEQVRQQALLIQQQQQKQKERLIQQQKQEQEKTQQTIDILLTKAATDIKKMRLSSPKGNNAVEKYQQVLQLEPNSDQAQQGMIEIVKKYLQLVEKSQKKYQFNKAKQYLEVAKNLQPDNLAINEVGELLKVAENKYQKLGVMKLPIWKVGDTWTYKNSYKALGYRSSEKVVEETTYLGQEVYKVLSKGGGSMLNVDSYAYYSKATLNMIAMESSNVKKTYRYEYPKGNNQWPMWVGKHWKVKKTMNGSITVTDNRVVTKEIFNVGKENFDCFKVVSNSSNSSVGFDRKSTTWWCPKLKNFGKVQITTWHPKTAKQMKSKGSTNKFELIEFSPAP